MVISSQYNTITALKQISLLTCTNRSTMMEWPSEAAMWRGVLSTLVRASLLTPARSSTSAVERWPYWAARCSGDEPSWREKRRERENTICKGAAGGDKICEMIFIILIQGKWNSIVVNESKSQSSSGQKLKCLTSILISHTFRLLLC